MAKYLMSDFLLLTYDLQAQKLTVQQFKEKFLKMFEEAKDNYSEEERKMLMSFYNEALEEAGENG